MKILQNHSLNNKIIGKHNFNELCSLLRTSPYKKHSRSHWCTWTGHRQASFDSTWLLNSHTATNTLYSNTHWRPLLYFVDSNSVFQNTFYQRVTNHKMLLLIIKAQSGWILSLNPFGASLHPAFLLDPSLHFFFMKWNCLIIWGPDSLTPVPRFSLGPFNPLTGKCRQFVLVGKHELSEQ